MAPNTIFIAGDQLFVIVGEESSWLMRQKA